MQILAPEKDQCEEAKEENKFMKKKYLLKKIWLCIKPFNLVALKSLYLVTVFAMSKSVTKSRVRCVRKLRH